jgi:hypothetical protein
MLRKLFSQWLVCLALVAIPWFAAADTTAQKPEAFLPEALFEFTPVVEGTEISHAFVIHNRGEAPLEILKVTSG